MKSSGFKQRRELLPSCVAGIILLGTHLLPTPHNGNLAGMPTLCPLKFSTGLPCPGCGMTRALVFCAHGDWAQAFSFHPLGPVFYITLWFALVLGILSLFIKLKPISTRAALLLGSTCGASLLMTWIIRLTGVLPFPANF